MINARAYVLTDSQEQQLAAFRNKASKEVDGPLSRGVFLPATAIASRIVKAGRTVEVVSRDPARTRALADKRTAGAITGTYGATPAGDIVILAVPYSGAAAAVADYGSALDGKTIIDIANLVAPDLSGLVTSHGSSGAQEMARIVAAGESVVKAFNTIFGHILAKGGPLDAFNAADDAEAKARVQRSSKVSGCVRSMSAACTWPDAGGARPDDDRSGQKRGRILGLRHERRYWLRRRHASRAAQHNAHDPFHGSS